ncbi:O-antigen ligase family protein [Candidatus Sumerlaeota bacterium]|nr:O-antigen ligase family protein [Candidatus Sumerlaeota bacterium]
MNANDVSRPRTWTWPSPTSAFWPSLIAFLLPFGALSLLLRQPGGDPTRYIVATSLPLALMAVVFLLGLPLLSLYLLVLWVPVQYFFTIDVPILPAAADRFDEFLLFVLTVACLIRLSREKRFLDLCPWIAAPATLFLAVGLASTLLNRVPLAPALFGIAMHIEYLLAFWIVANLRPRDRTMRRLVALLLIYAFVQIPIMFWQWKQAGAAFALLAGDAPDLLRGTMGPGGGNAVGYFVLLGIGLLLGLYRARASGSQTLRLAGAFALLFPFILSGSRISLVVLGVFLAWLFLRPAIRQPRQLLILAAMGLCLVGGVYYYITRVLVDSEDILTLELNLRAESNPASVGRIAYYPISWEVLHRHSFSPLIGTGPATYFSLAGRKYSPPLAEAYNYRWQGGLPPSGVLGTGVEYGYLGLAAMYWIVLSFFRIARTVWRRTRDRYWEGIARGYFVALLLFAISPLITNVWEFQTFAFTVWFLGGALYLHARREGLFADSR